jgi:hypothetical protein
MKEEVKDVLHAIWASSARGPVWLHAAIFIPMSALPPHPGVLE